MSAEAELAIAPRTSLCRILGLGFGLAVIFGGTVGVGILRLPGTIAAQMGSFWPDHAGVDRGWRLCDAGRNLDC
jgi:hypothetical protein